MLHVIVVGDPDTDQERTLSTLVQRWVEAAGTPGGLNIKLLYLSSVFSTEADKLISNLRTEATGLLFVMKTKDLSRHTIDNFISRLGSEHPKINFAGMPAGIIVEDETVSRDALRLAKLKLLNLKKMKMYTFPPAFSMSERTQLIKDLESARISKAA